MRLLADPRLRSDGSGFIYRTPARRDRPAGGADEQLVVALRTAEKVLGFIVVDNLTSGRRLTAADAPLLVAFAASLAATVENVQLLEERTRNVGVLHTDLQRRMAELEWLRDISRRITESRTRAEVLDVVYHGLRAGLGYDRAGINLFDHEAGVFEDCIGTDAAGAMVRPMNRTVGLAAASPIWRFPGIAALLRGAEFYYTPDAGAECPPELRYLFDGVPTHNLMAPLRDELKIDRSFVQHILDEETDDTIVASTIALGHNLGLRVVAEGVENRRTWQRLAELGCDVIQGYYVSRPLPAEEWDQWLRQTPWAAA